MDAVGIIACFNFLTRVADALGVEVNPEFARVRKADLSGLAG